MKAVRAAPANPKEIASLIVAYSALCCISQTQEYLISWWKLNCWVTGSESHLSNTGPCCGAFQCTRPINQAVLGTFLLLGKYKFINIWYCRHSGQIIYWKQGKSVSIISERTNRKRQCLTPNQLWKWIYSALCENKGYWCNFECRWSLDLIITVSLHESPARDVELFKGNIKKK